MEEFKPSFQEDLDILGKNLLIWKVEDLEKQFTMIMENSMKIYML
jgi:hypothetical protein